MHGFATPKCVFAPGGFQVSVIGYWLGRCLPVLVLLHQVEVYFVLGQ